MSKTLMIVDDIEFVRKTLIEIVSDAKYKVVAEADCVEKALELYKEHRPDIVLMDIVMPGVSGIDAVRTLLKMDKDAKVIIVSALGQESMVMEAIAVGAKDFVIKPFFSNELILSLDRIAATVKTHGSNSEQRVS